MAMANVGLFYANKNPAIVPTFLLSLNVALPARTFAEECQVVLCLGIRQAAGLVVIEVVSNREGHGDGEKLTGMGESASNTMRSTIRSNG